MMDAAVNANSVDRAAPGRAQVASVPFEDWYAASWPKLVGALTLVVRNRELAQDLSAQAMVKAYERWDEGVIVSPTSWVHQVAINLARRRARRVALELRYATAVKQVADSTPELAPEIWQSVAALPRQQRTAVALRYVGDLTQAQVAEAMGLSPGAVAAHLSTARTRLKATLRNDLLEDLK